MKPADKEESPRPGGEKTEATDQPAGPDHAGLRTPPSQGGHRESGGVEGGGEFVTISAGPVLDLHTWRPRDLPDLLPEWFTECQALGILTVRVVHGKGSGTLRAGVHALLPRLQPRLVAHWSWPAPERSGGWGATLVQLRSPAAGPGSSGPSSSREKNVTPGNLQS